MHIRTSRLAALCAGSISALLFSMSAAQAAETADAGGPSHPDAPELEEVVVTATRGAAPQVAPSTAPLSATQPTAIINRTFIEDSVADTSDYSGIALFAPGVSSGLDSNGPGLSEKDIVIRGFGDGEYNVTYDGIPFGDTNDPTHHSTAYFPASTIGAVQIDRGPGEAGDLGQENFGGALHLFSRTLSDIPYAQQKLTYGTWNTINAVTTLQSGPIKQLHGTRITANFQELTSDGYLTFAKVREFNQFFKSETPITDRWTLTLLATFNQGRIHDPDNDGVTLAQAKAFGKNYSMNNDPASPAYWGYNSIKKRTYFGYARLKGDLGDGFGLENTTYAYGYRNSTLSATDVTQDAAEVAAGTYPSDAVGTKAAPAGNHDVAGYDKLNSYWVYGDILRFSKDFGFGQLRFGGLYETAFTDRHRFDLDRTLGLPNPIEKPPAFGPIPPANIQFLEHSKWRQYQLFADFEIHPTSRLTVTPGVKYVNFTRTIESPVESKTRLVDVDTHATYTKTLPFLTANYRLNDHLAAYAQYAEGFLIPPLSSFYVPLFNNHPVLRPQKSVNYQTGFVWNTDRFTLDADVYYINFTDKFGKVGPKSDPFFVNLPGTTVYKGVEGEGSYLLGGGLSLFASGSLNSAKDDTGKQIASAPQWTSAAGLIYKAHGWTASFLNKFTGPQWAIDGEDPNYKIGSYSVSNLVVGYDFGRVKTQVGVYNLFDHRDVTDISQKDGPTANPLDNHDQYFFLPARSVQFTLRATY